MIDFDAITGGNSQDGWRTARDIPVQRRLTEDNSNVRDPISCRKLSNLYENRNVGNAYSVKDSTRVWSPDIIFEKALTEVTAMCEVLFRVKNYRVCMKS